MGQWVNDSGNPWKDTQSMINVISYDIICHMLSWNDIRFILKTVRFTSSFPGESRMGRVRLPFRSCDQEVSPERLSSHPLKKGALAGNNWKPWCDFWDLLIKVVNRP